MKENAQKEPVEIKQEKKWFRFGRARPELLNDTKKRAHLIVIEKKHQYYIWVNPAATKRRRSAWIRMKS